MSNDPIIQALNLSTMTNDENLPVVIDNEGTEKLIDDFNKSRSNLLDVVRTTMETISSLKELAERSQAARFYEALNATLKTAIDANKALIEVHNEVRQVANLKNNTTPKHVTNQNLFVSTTELMKLLEKIKQDDATTIHQS